MACTSNCNSHSSEDKTELWNNCIFYYFAEMEAEKRQALWPHSGDKGKVQFSPALNLILLLRVGDLQKQTELTPPVNTRSSEIKVSSLKFVCLHSSLNIQQYNIHSQKACRSRWDIKFLMAINLTQTHPQI